MYLDANTLINNTKLDCDICIMGGGVAGLVLAHQLANTSLNVIVVDAGGKTFLIDLQDTYAPEVQHPIFPDPTYSRLKFLGGSSNHWQNNTSRFNPLDFELRDWIQESGWPISYSDIAPYYKAAERYCGVETEERTSNEWFAALNKNNIAADSSNLQSQIAKFSRPPMRFYAELGDELEQSPSITILSHANIVDTTFNSQNKEITSVTAKNHALDSISIRATKFVMCFGGIDNARLLLAFNSKYENKLGNQGDSVGRYFMEHPTPRAAQFYTDKQALLDFYHTPVELENKAVGAFLSLKDSCLQENSTINLRLPFFPATNFELSHGVSSFHILSEALANGELPDEFGGHTYNILADLDDIIEAVSRKKWNKKLFEDADIIGGFQLPMMMEQTPSKENRVTIGSKKDMFGVPRTIIDWHLTDTDKDMLWKSLDIVSHELAERSLGRLQLLKERSPRLWTNQLGFSDHHMGTTRMATSPDSGVVDANAQVFGTNNLFMAGSSVFSTGSHVPPTLTIVALSIRLADHLRG